MGMRVAVQCLKGLAVSVLAVLACMSLLGCHPASRKEPERKRPYAWATNLVVRDFVTGGRPVLSPPVGYEFSIVSIPVEEFRNNRHWFVSFKGDREGRGIEIEGTALGTPSRGMTMEDYCEEVERIWATPRPPVERLEPRLVGDELACGFRGVDAWVGMSPQEQRVLCRSDNCWWFSVKGDDGSLWVPGELLAVLDTVRFISPVEAKPDFRLGESGVSPSASPTK
ncbi:MAG: hypothetical protein Q4D96_07820 [Propionibacteriaceae bacterium]|nr:hypothetical protein [Propionibacteriaceae bacterium]